MNDYGIDSNTQDIMLGIERVNESLEEKLSNFVEYFNYRPKTIRIMCTRRQDRGFYYIC